MAATKKTTAASSELKIEPIELLVSTVRIVGITPLITHCWSEKAKKEMLDNERVLTKVKNEKPIRVPVLDFMNSLYWLSDKPDIDEIDLQKRLKSGDLKPEDADKYVEEAVVEAIENGARFGFPATGLKQAAVMASSRNETGLMATKLRGAFFIMGEGPNQCVEIKGCKPSMREDMVQVGGISKSADLRYRGCFDDWYCDLDICYNKNGVVSLEQIINLINLGGFICGAGEWRMEKDGSYGLFQVDPTVQIVTRPGTLEELRNSMRTMSV